MLRFRHLSGRYCAVFLRLNQLRIRGIIQRNQCGFSKPLFLSADQTAELKLMKYPRRTLSAAVQLLLRLFQGEVQPDRAVRLDVAVLPGNAGSVQQQRVERLGVVADVPQGFILEKKPGERYIGCRRALRREPYKKFSSDLLSHPSIHPFLC